MREICTAWKFTEGTVRALVRPCPFSNSLNLAVREHFIYDSKFASLFARQTLGVCAFNARYTLHFQQTARKRNESTKVNNALKTTVTAVGCTALAEIGVDSSCMVPKTNTIMVLHDTQRYITKFWDYKPPKRLKTLPSKGHSCEWRAMKRTCTSLVASALLQHRESGDATQRRVVELTCVAVGDQVGAAHGLVHPVARWLFTLCQHSSTHDFVLWATSSHSNANPQECRRVFSSRNVRNRCIRIGLISLNMYTSSQINSRTFMVKCNDYTKLRVFDRGEHTNWRSLCREETMHSSAKKGNASFLKGYLFPLP